MKEVMAVIRMNMINSTKKALINAGVSSMTAMEALGRGKGLVDVSLLKGAEQGYEEHTVSPCCKAELLNHAAGVLTPHRRESRMPVHFYYR